MPTSRLSGAKVCNGVNPAFDCGLVERRAPALRGALAFETPSANNVAQIREFVSLVFDFLLPMF